MSQTTNPSRDGSPRSQCRGMNRGFTIVEALVALVVLAIGLLGIAALYLDSLRASRTAIYRTQAVNIAADLADRVRTNRGAVLAYVTDFATTHTAVPACNTTAGCLPAELAATDLARLKTLLPQVLPGGEVAVAVTAPAAAGDPATYVVTVRWTEVGEAAPLQYQLRLTI